MNIFGCRCCIPQCNPCPPRPLCNATVTVGSTTTLEAGSPAYVTNTGTLQNAILNFGIPQGAQGVQGPIGATGPQGPMGPQGIQGEDGDAATMTIGTVTTLPAGSPATVTNVGTTTNAVLNFGIPQGATVAQGTAGTNGTAATITVGTVTALDPGSTPTVTNSGTTNAAVLDFGIPTINKGAAVADLDATATLDDVITAFNALLASLRTAGVIAQ